MRILFLYLAAESRLDTSKSIAIVRRYLDLSEAIEDGERTSANLDNSDFKSTEIPYDFALPTEQFLDDEAREEVRDWVLQLSMDGSVVQSLSTTETDFVRENLRLEDTVSAADDSSVAFCRELTPTGVSVWTGGVLAGDRVGLRRAGGARRAHDPQVRLRVIGGMSVWMIHG